MKHQTPLRVGFVLLSLGIVAVMGNYKKPGSIVSAKHSPQQPEEVIAVQTTSKPASSNTKSYVGNMSQYAGIQSFESSYFRAYEAEELEKDGFVTVSKTFSNYTGDGFVLLSNINAGVKLPELLLDRSQSAKLLIRYANGLGKPQVLTVQVDDEVMSVGVADTGDWNRWKELEVVVDIKDGSVIKLTSGKGCMVAVDSVELKRSLFGL